mgnify:CR=1 FL=1
MGCEKGELYSVSRFEQIVSKNCSTVNISTCRDKTEDCLHRKFLMS